MKKYLIFSFLLNAFYSLHATEKVDWSKLKNGPIITYDTSHELVTDKPQNVNILVITDKNSQSINYKGKGFQLYRASCMPWIGDYLSQFSFQPNICRVSEKDNSYVFVKQENVEADLEKLNLTVTDPVQVVSDEQKKEVIGKITKKNQMRMALTLAKEEDCMVSTAPIYGTKTITHESLKPSFFRQERAERKTLGIDPQGKMIVQSITQLYGPRTKQDNVRLATTVVGISAMATLGFWGWKAFRG